MPHPHEIIIIIIIIILSDVPNSRIIQENRPFDLFPRTPLNFSHHVFNILLDFIIRKVLFHYCLFF
jgi:hypothetical protein